MAMTNMQYVLGLAMMAADTTSNLDTDERVAGLAYVTREECPWGWRSRVEAYLVQRALAMLADQGAGGGGIA